MLAARIYFGTGLVILGIFYTAATVLFCIGVVLAQVL